MKKFFTTIALILALAPSFVLAQTTVQNGGTGTSSIPTNYVLLGGPTPNLRITAVATSSLGLPKFSDIPPYTWNFLNGYIKPTTTVGIIVSASSTIASLTTNDSTSTNATSTSLFSTLIRAASGAVSSPSFSFSGNSLVGMYLNGTGLGLAAGGAGITWDGSSLIPNSDNLRNLGSATNFWRGLFVNNSTSTNATSTNLFSSKGNFTNLCISGDCKTTWPISDVSNWNKQTNFNQLMLTPTTTIPIWSKSGIYASSSVYFQGDSVATTTIGDNNAFLTIGRRDLGGAIFPNIKIPTIFGDTLTSDVGPVGIVGINSELGIIENKNANSYPKIDFIPNDFGVTGDSASIYYATDTPAVGVDKDFIVDTLAGSGTRLLCADSSGLLTVTGCTATGGLWEFNDPFTTLSSSTPLWIPDVIWSTSDTFAGLAAANSSFGNISTILYAPSVKAWFVQNADEFRISNGNLTVQNGFLGVGTTSPFSIVSITGSSTIARDIFTVAASTTNSILFTIDQAGMQYTGGDTPVISGCGSGPSIVGNNNAGRVTVGSTGIGVSCTVTFADGGWQKTANAPACVLNAEGTQATPLNLSSISKTAFSTNVAATLSGATFVYQCKGF